MSESAIEKFVCDRAERNGWFQRKMKWIGVDGAPDRFFAKNKRVLLIEFKAPGEPARISQIDEHRRLLKAGVELHVCDNAAAALKVLGIA